VNKGKLILCCLLAVIFLLLFGSSCYAAVEFYVSLNGNDANSGTREHPIASLDHARQIVTNPKLKAIARTPFKSPAEISNSSVTRDAVIRDFLGARNFSYAGHLAATTERNYRNSYRINIFQYLNVKGKGETHEKMQFNKYHYKVS